MQPLRPQQLVLIADDNPVNLDVLCTVLSREQLDLAVVSDGLMALELVHGDLPDLVLLDVQMPGLDGFEVCRRLKEDERTRDIPIIFMTSHSDPGHRVRGLSLGAVDYISKPFEEAELLARVRTQLSLRRLTLTLQQQNLRLSEQIRERAAAEQAREALTQQLLRRTEELHQANAQLAAELLRREQAEAARAELQSALLQIERERVLEMSTPLIPITDSIVVMPLIGTVDAERARRVLEVAMQGTSERRARFLILDLTGLREVDDDVVALLLRVSTGLRLLGSRAILTGISPQIAGLLAARDIATTALTTYATLQDGIRSAMSSPLDPQRRQATSAAGPRSIP
jgi:CheY-like chemotaxis protein/anti-anti-sigma regulatory factor